MLFKGLFFDYKKFLKIFFFFLFLSFSFPVVASRHFPPGERDVFITSNKNIRTDLLKNIAPIVENGINAGAYPGAVILAGHRGHAIYRGIFGNRRIEPTIAPMRFDTIFDLASLTKVLAVTPAVMQLIEQSKLDLDAPVAKYWPAFGNHGKSAITVRELLTHTSGLPPDLNDPAHAIFSAWHGETGALHEIENLHLQHAPGTTYIYSDINFIILAYLVEIISGKSINKYAQEHIFKPLQMTNTYYLPPAILRDRIAPTEIIDKKLRWGIVHDPIAYAMGGVSGTAGLFSDANDLALYAQCLLNNGRIPGKKRNYLLGPLAILKMTSAENPATVVESHGLGWDIDSAYSSRGLLFSMRSYGHTGWTGTSIWIDPVTQSYLIILTSRTHPTSAEDNRIIRDRRAIANIVAASLTDVPLTNQTNTGKGELVRAYSGRF